MGIEKFRRKLLVIDEKVPSESQDPGEGGGGAVTSVNGMTGDVVIPASAMSGPDIKAAYEDEANTNAFTDAAKTKLDTLAQVASSGSFAHLSNVPEFITEDQVGVPGGVAPLDDAGMVPLDDAGMVPLDVINVSGLSYLGSYDADTNTPGLINGTGADGDFYKVSVAGNVTFGNGFFDFSVGDWVIYAGGEWQRIGVHESVSSVNGKTGMVVLNAADVGALDDSYVPDWSDIANKPDMPDAPAPQRGSIGPAIPALFATKIVAQTIANGSPLKKVTFTGVKYDEFDAWSGTLYTVPSWAKYARVTSNVLLAALPAGGRAGPYIYRNGDRITLQVTTVAGTQAYGPIISPIFPVVSGDQLSVDYWHSHTAPLTSPASESAWIQIELYE